MTEREFATDVVRRLRDAGFEALFAGGCVRDMLLGREPDDFDVATSAKPDEVQKLFRKTIAVGVSFGVIEVLGPKPLAVQVATFRADGPYSDGRRPDSVQFCTAREDALRRDFTINGIFYDPIAETIIDHVGGETDLRASVLRAIGDPVQRFTEDRLRLLRAARFAARLRFAIDPATLAAVKSMANQVVTVSGERIAEELRKLLTHPTRAFGARLLSETGLWRTLFPEVSAIDEAVLAALDQLGEQASFPLAFAACMGSLPPKKLDGIATRMRLSNTDRERIAWLVARRETIGEASSLAPHDLKPLLAHLGIRELLALERAFGGDVSFCETKLAEWPAAVLDPPPLITGEDLIARGFKPGPKFKQMLVQVRNAQLDGLIASTEEAMQMIDLS